MTTYNTLNDDDDEDVEVAGGMVTCILTEDTMVWTWVNTSET
jgi:hypothetical protein